MAAPSISAQQRDASHLPRLITSDDIHQLTWGHGQKTTQIMWQITRRSTLPIAVAPHTIPHSGFADLDYNWENAELKSREREPYLTSELQIEGEDLRQSKGTPNPRGRTSGAPRRRRTRRGAAESPTPPRWHRTLPLSVHRKRIQTVSSPDRATQLIKR
jgi:hypothetical protein